MTLTYRVRVVRKQKWDYVVEADSREEAKEQGDKMAAEEPPQDDWAFETTAVLAATQPKRQA